MRLCTPGVGYPPFSSGATNPNQVGPWVVDRGEAFRYIVHSCEISQACLFELAVPDQMAMFRTGRGRLTGGTVIPSGNPLDVLCWDHDVVKRCIITSSLREGKPWLIKPGQSMLFSFGRRIIFEKETWTRKPTPKPDALSQWCTMEVQRHATWMETNEKKKKKTVHPAARVACQSLYFCVCVFFYCLFQKSHHLHDLLFATVLSAFPVSQPVRVTTPTFEV